jgi:hypothetical protein
VIGGKYCHQIKRKKKNIDTKCYKLQDGDYNYTNSNVDQLVLLDTTSDQCANAKHEVASGLRLARVLYRLFSSASRGSERNGFLCRLSIATINAFEYVFYATILALN